jgi:ribosomal protein S19
MWSLSKPPLLNWLIISYLKYKKKKLITKIWPIKLVELMVSEKFSIYLLLVKKFFFSIINFLKIKFENFFFQFFSISLVFHSSKNIFSIENNRFFFFLKQNLLDYASFFWRKDLSFNWSKYLFLSKNKLWNPGVDFFFFKNFLYIINNKIFDKTFIYIKNVNNLFFFNIFYYTLIVNIFQIKNKFSIYELKKIFYFGLDFVESILYNIHDLTISEYNRFLSLQTGTLKVTKYFVNWNYLFAVSTQLFWARKNFFFKFFFKNNRFRLFKKYKQFTWESTKKNNKEGIHIWSRSTVILPFFINKIFFIYNGNKFFWVWVLPGMVGYKLGQFSFTWKIHTRNINLKNYFKGLFS